VVPDVPITSVPREGDDGFLWTAGGNAVSMTLDERTRKAVAAARALSDELYAKAIAERRHLTEVENEAIDRAISEAKALRREVDGRRDLDALTKGMSLAGGRTGHPTDDLTTGGAGYSYGGTKMDSIGQQFVESEQYREAKASGLFKGTGWSMPPVTAEFKTTLTETPPGGGAALAQPDLLPGIIPTALPRLTIADLIPQGTTVSNAVRMLKEQTFTNAAAATAEAAAKPESALVFQQVDEPVVKLAHFLPVSDEMLEDSAQLSAFINARLIAGVQLVEEAQLLNGNGTAPNLQGILARTGLAAPVARGTNTNADAVLAQVTAIEASGAFSVDAIVMNPTNWATIVGSKDGQQRYYGMGPLAGASQGNWLWGRRLVATPSIAAGTALVGAFSQAAMIFRRSGVDVSATNSHQDFFTKNLTAIRAEERLALAVFQPGAIGTVTGLN
jgi:HK97 family phage major capsid protein